MSGLVSVHRLPYFYIFATGSFMNLELTSSTRLARQRALGACLSSHVTDMHHPTWTLCVLGI